MNKKNEQNLCSVKIWSITNRRWPWLKVILGLLLILIVHAVILVKNLGDNSRLRENNSVVNSEVATNKVTIKDEFRVDWRDDKTKNTKIQKGKRKTPKRTTVELKNNLKSRDLKGKKLIALTFDDGPKRETTEELLKVLREKQVKVSFFVLGIMVEKAPDLVKRAEKEGHEIGNHTTYHKDLRLLSAEAIKQDIGITNDLIKNSTGQIPKLSRLPYGAFNETVCASVDLPIIAWNIDARDWEIRNADQIYRQVMAQVREGGVILMHDIYATTIAAVPRIIDDLRTQGYEFVTVGELARLRGVKLVSGQIYYGF